ncbi:hypothetical protein D3C85_1891560 [compost metagenome]
MSRAKTPPTTGTRFNSNSQPDQPMSCRRCTPMSRLTTMAAMAMAAINRPPRTGDMPMSRVAIKNSGSPARKQAADQAR